MDGQQKFRRKSAKFETMQQQQQKKRVKRRIFYTFLLVFFSAAFFTICFTVFFKVKNIDLDGNNKYTPEEIIKTLQISSGDNMYSFNSAETSEKLIKQFPYIQTAEITRVLPSTVKVSIIEKKVVMYIYACNEYYLLAPDFTVLERSDELRYDGLIQLKCGDIKRCMTGEQLSFSDSKLTPTLAELYQLMSTYKINDKIKSINVENRFDITFNYDDRLDVFIGSITDCEIKIRFFLGIIERLYDDDKGKLDLSNPKEATFSPKS